MGQVNSDLVLAKRVLAGNARAVATFETNYITPLMSTLRRKGVNYDDAVEVVQQTRLRLLSPVKGGAPALAAFTGRGSLNAFVFTLLFRLLHNHQRPTKTPLPEQLVAQLSSVTTPELALRRKEERERFATIVRDVWESLEPSDQKLLGYRVRKLSIDEIADCTGTHRATAARRVRSATAAFVARTNELALQQDLARGEYSDFAHQVFKLLALHPYHD